MLQQAASGRGASGGYSAKLAAFSLFFCDPCCGSLADFQYVYSSAAELLKVLRSYILQIFLGLSITVYLLHVLRSHYTHYKSHTSYVDYSILFMHACNNMVCF